MLRMHALLFPQLKSFKNHSLHRKLHYIDKHNWPQHLPILFPPLTFQSLPCVSMAKLFSFILFSLFISHLLLLAVAKPNASFAKRLNPTKFGLMKEKLTHFRVYWHDVVSGPKPSSVRVVIPQNVTITGFGIVSMIDNALTVAPRLNSKVVGRAQGFYACASQSEVGLLMAMNFAFMEGKYNGSTISILGRNSVFSKVREMPIIGGSGLFRFARGYVQASTHSFDVKSGDANVEYNVYVLHY